MEKDLQKCNEEQHMKLVIQHMGSLQKPYEA